MPKRTNRKTFNIPKTNVSLDCFVLFRGQYFKWLCSHMYSERIIMFKDWFGLMWNLFKALSPQWYHRHCCTVCNVSVGGTCVPVINNRAIRNVKLSDLTQATYLISHQKKEFWAHNFSFFLLISPSTFSVDFLPWKLFETRNQLKKMKQWYVGRWHAVVRVVIIDFIL